MKTLIQPVLAKLLSTTQIYAEQLAGPQKTVIKCELNHISSKSNHLFYLENVKQQYSVYLPTPTIANEECNSTQNYNGLLPENSICVAYSNGENKTCYVSISIVIFERFLTKFIT